MTTTKKPKTPHRWVSFQCNAGRLVTRVNLCGVFASLERRCMSYTYLQEQGEGSSAECFSGIKPLAMDKFLLWWRSHGDCSGVDDE